MEYVTKQQFAPTIVRSESGVLLLPQQVLDFETKIIKHDGYVFGMEQTGKVHSRYRPPSAGKRFKARCLLIVGESGAGKSTILETYANQFPPLTLEDLQAGRPEALELSDMVKNALQDADLRRVMRMEVPERATRRSFVAAALGMWGYKARDHWDTNQIIDRVVFLVNETRTELILLDEGHQLVNQSNPEATADIIEFIKSLLNRIGVSIVIAGLPKLLDAVKKSGDKQLKRRMVKSVVLRPYKWTTHQGRLRFRALLMSFEENLGLPSPSNLHEHETAMRIYVATGGEVGIVSQYLSEALQLVLTRGLQSITIELLAEVHAGLETIVDAFEDEIPFDEEIIEDPGVDATRNAANNPFLCPKEELKSLWPKLHMVRVKRHEAELVQLDGVASTDAGRQTSIRGKGSKSYSPFA